MRDALTIPIGMQLPARFRNDAHTGLDSQVGRNFVLLKMNAIVGISHLRMSRYVKFIPHYW